MKRGEAAENGVLEMVVWNSDGSLAKMCGNGLRVVASYEFERVRAGHGDKVTFSTGAGEKEVTLVAVGGETLFRAAMGKATVLPFPDALVPPLVTGPIGSDVSFHLVDVGNRHIVVVLPDSCPLYPDAPDQGSAIPALAAALQRPSPHLPTSANVNFVKVLGESVIAVRTFESGVGETLACGTGCCASARAYLVSVLDRPSGTIECKLKLGSLIIDVQGESVTMTGPARHDVFQGSVKIDVRD